MKKVYVTASLIFILSFMAIIFLVQNKINLDLIHGSENIFWGSRGEEVKYVQTKLKQWGYYKGGIDGIYGYDLYLGVRYFQEKNGLKVDGIVGDSTKEALGINIYKDKSSGASSYNSDVYLLARAINGESRGEPYIGQVAVGAVILNRTKDAKFPHTIAGVIYQPGAFVAVDDGQINLEPEASCVKAAKDAYNGWDPTGGAIYYWNPATATSKWIWTLKPTLKIGNHWFAKGPY